MGRLSGQKLEIFTCQVVQSFCMYEAVFRTTPSGRKAAHHPSLPGEPLRKIGDELRLKKMYPCIIYSLRRVKRGNTDQLPLWRVVARLDTKVFVDELKALHIQKDY